MASTVPEFRNSDNFSKFQLFHYQTGVKVCIQVLHWLYKGQSPIEHLVVDLTNTKEIKIDGAEEKKMIDDLESGNIGLSQLGLNLLYKIAQSICGLKNIQDKVSAHQDTLEFLLFSLIDGQNNVKNITESDFEDKSVKLRLLLESIIQKAGERGNVDVQEINETIFKLQYDIQSVCNDDEYNKCGSKVISKILLWLYQGLSPIEHLVIDLTKMKPIKIDKREKSTLTNNIRLSHFDITFLYKIIPVVCGLAEKKDDKQDELEYLLFKLKSSRNDVSHPDPEAMNITDLIFDVKSKEMKILLTSIIEKAGQRANIDVQEIRDTVSLIENDIERICNNDKIDDSMKPYILSQIVKDLKFSYEEELKTSFEKDLKGFSIPYFRSSNSREKISLLNLLILFEEFPFIVVQGETGEGKSSLTRFLLHSWLYGKTDAVEGLSSFEVVLRVDCSQVSCSDIIRFYEKLIPNASSVFPKKVSLEKSFDDFRVFWIMDGFDESTPEYKRFLIAMIKSMSDKHKLLITTRPNTYKDLKGILVTSKRSITTLTLELLQDQNVEDIIQTLIIDDENKNKFKALFYSLDETAKHLLRTPLNLNLYIELWIQDPKLVQDHLTTKVLFLKIIGCNLKLLENRLKGCTSLASEDLKDYVNHWFYGSLCKQSFLMLMHWRHKNFSKEDLDTLKKGARPMLVPSTCLSTFLEYDEGNDEAGEGEYRYKFRHSTQQYILASLFLKHFKEYDGENVINSIYTSFMNIIQIQPSLNLLTFYVEMIKEDGSLDSNFKQVFFTIKTIINKHSACPDESIFDFWFHTSVASDFNAKYMENVPLATNANIFLEIDYFNDFLNLTKLFEFFPSIKIYISISDLLSTTWKFGFGYLREFLINFNIEIELKVYNDNFYKTYIEKNEKLATTDSNRLSEHDTNLEEKISISRPVEDELWINLDFFWFPSDYLTVPKENVENTTLRIFKIKKSNFEKALEFLINIKGEESLKFKALYHDWNDISETGRRQLLEISNSVLNDPSCQLKEFCIQQIIHLNVTAFYGIMNTLDLLKTHHVNSKTIFLHINSEIDFCRMLTFLHENKTTLNDVSISLTGHDFSNFQHWERKTFFDEIETSANGFTFPQELVQHSTLYIDEINDENFQDYFKLLNNVKGDEILKFKACSFTHLILSSDKQRHMLDQMTINLTCANDRQYTLATGQL